MRIVLVMTVIYRAKNKVVATYSSALWMTAILDSNSAWMYMYFMGLIDYEFICVEHTLIVLRKYLHIPIMT